MFAVPLSRTATALLCGFLAKAARHFLFDYIM